MGPHKFCSNCANNYNRGGDVLEYWDGDPNKLVLYNKEESPIIEAREGEPYFISKNNIDEHVNNLGNFSNVFAKTVNLLEKYRQDKFFMFMHFTEPDILAHRYGENSSEYGQAIIQLDGLTEDLIVKLKELDIYDETILYLVTDHGIDEGGDRHDFAPETFFCSVEKNLSKNGDRKDVAPTILRRYGFDVDKINPPLDGKALIQSK